MEDEPDNSAESSEPTIVEALGFELEVSNEALADALRAAVEDSDAPVALPDDPGEVRQMRADASEALPDVLIAVPTPRDAEEARQRAELRHRANAIGTALGFTVDPDGAWHAASGEGMAVRFVTTLSSEAAAADLVAKIAQNLQTSEGIPRALLVTLEQKDADELAHLIAVRDTHIRFRVASLHTLNEVAGLCAEGRIDAMLAQGLLIPASHADVARMLALLVPLLARP